MAAGLLFNAIITLASFYILYKTLLNLCDRSKAKLTLMLFAFFPGSYIFFWFYAEALTTFLIVCAFYFLSNKRILLSSIFVGLATFTRPNAALSILFGQRLIKIFINLIYCAPKNIFLYF